MPKKARPQTEGLGRVEHPTLGAHGAVAADRRPRRRALGLGYHRIDRVDPPRTAEGGAGVQRVKKKGNSDYRQV